MNLINSLNSNDFIILTGAPGVGKTRLALEVISLFLKNNNKYKGYCISFKNHSLIEDLYTNLSLKENYVLFVGTIDYLRKDTILDLIEYTREIGKELWLVGEDNGNYLENLLLEDHVKHFPSTWKVEDFILKSYETAGIQLGRTTIESWMCGKSSWIYKVDKGGFILSKEKYEPPTDIEKYYTMGVAQQIKDEYLKILS